MMATLQTALPLDAFFHLAATMMNQGQLLQLRRRQRQTEQTVTEDVTLHS
jgi:hypothetical protein